MANVNIKFNNKEYLLSCDNGQEENLKELASHLDKKYNALKKNLGNLGENKLLLITSIQMIDDYFALFNKAKKSKNDFEKISIKFKELKILAIKYKEDKEREIGQLKDELSEFKNISTAKFIYIDTDIISKCLLVPFCSICSSWFILPPIRSNRLCSDSTCCCLPRKALVT